jgi:hypothetical protein
MWNLGLLGASLGFSSDFELIASTVLTSNEPSVTFNNLDAWSSTYKHLQIRTLAKGTSGSQVVSMRINGETGSVYSSHGLTGEIESGVRAVRSFGTSSQNSIFRVAAQGNGTPADSFGAGIIDVLDFSSSKTKTIKSLSGQVNSGDESIALFSGLYNSASPINSIIIYRDSSSFVSGSRFSLYGIRG